MFIIFFDTETTGLPRHPTDYRDLPAYETARLYEISWLVVDHRLEVVEHVTSLIRDDFTFPADYPFPHPSPLDFANGRPLVDVLTQFTAVISQPGVMLVGHNVAFDWNLIRAELYRAQLPIPPTPAMLCTMQVATEFTKLPSKNGRGYKWPRLSELYLALYGCQPSETHRADADVDTTLRCFVGMIYRKWLPSKLCELFDTPWGECGMC